MIRSLPIVERRFTSRQVTAGAVIGLLLVAALLFVPAAGGYWLADDFDWVRTFSRYPWADVPRLFRGDWSKAASNEYRPLWALSFMLDLRLWGASPRALHATSILLHLIASALVFWLAGTARGATRASGLLALAFFALAPIHDEPVAWVSARGHILAPIFMLLALILLRRFEERGGLGIYLGSLAAAAAALATQEVAAALPALLLLRDLVDAPRPDRRWLLRIAALHAPFWLLLAAYLGLRVAIFGRVGRDSTPDSPLALARSAYVAVRTLWLSPLSLRDVTAPLVGAAEPLLIVLVAGLLGAPLLLLARRERGDYARGLAYFAVVWPIVATAVLMGASSPRHFYLASIGPAVALGLAASRLLALRRAPRIAGVALAAALLLVYGYALERSVAGYARNGQLSRQLMAEIQTAIDRSTRDPGAALVIIPELPDSPRVFWEYFYPDALDPLFTGRTLAPDLIPSFASCGCSAEEWMSAHGDAFRQLAGGSGGAIYVVEWDAGRGAFVTRALDRPAFRAAGYLAPGGPLVRPRWPGQPEPIARSPR